MKPKLFSIWKHRKLELTREQVQKDIVSGIIVAIIALPLSVALGIASGVTPEKGLITAIIAGFLISLLGGSRVQIGGPTGAFVVIIYGIIQKYGIDGLMISTVMAGIFMILLGLLRLGSVIKFIPYPTTTGFTSGIALVLISTQIKDLLGLEMTEVPSEFIAKWKAYILNIQTINWYAAAIGIASIAIIVLWPKVNKKIPGSLVALIIPTAIVTIFNIPVETIGSRFGEISANIQLVDITKFQLSLGDIKELITPAITIALLASIESLLSAVVADGMIGKKHNSNMELVGQGVANIFSAFFGGIPATGAIARTAANIKNGGRTPIAGIVHAITLFLIMIVLMPLAKLIPMTCLAAILFVVAYNMSEWRSFKAILKSTKSDSIVLVTTFVVTVLFDLVNAIEIGMIVSMFLFVKRMSESKLLENVSHELDDYMDLEDSDEGQEFSYNNEIAIYEINGPLFYGVVNTFLDTLKEIHSNTKILILKMKYVNSMDASALKALEQLDARCKSQKILIIYSQINEQPYKMLENSGYISKIGSDRFVSTDEEAMMVAKDLIKFRNSIKKIRVS